jgi:hypothetical protein
MPEQAYRSASQLGLLFRFFSFLAPCSPLAQLHHGPPTVPSKKTYESSVTVMESADHSEPKPALSDEENSAREQQLTEGKTVAAPPFGDYPEGGARAWMTVGGASACLFVSFGWVNCAGVFQDYYQAHQLASYSPSEIAWIPALQSMPIRSSVFILHPRCLGRRKDALVERC